MYLRGITLGAEWIYRNAFTPARLFDDEIAVATCLTGMAAWLDGGPDVCSLADAARSGAPMRAAGHVWDMLD